MSNEFSKQHYLPKCYLNEFTNPSGEFYYLNLTNLNNGRDIYPRKTSPSSVCYNFDYYTIDKNLKSKYPHLNKYHSLEVEKVTFSKFENNYNKIIKKIKQRLPLDQNDVEILSNFCIDIKTRNQYWRDNFINKNKDTIIKGSFEKIIENIDKEQLKPFPGFSSEEFDRIVLDMRAKIQTDPDFGKQMHISGLISRNNDSNSFKIQMCNMLSYCEWTIFETNYTTFFITSDNPGFSVDENDGLYNTKFDCKFMYFIPLTPCYCLMISNQRTDKKFYDEGVKNIHYRQGNHALISMLNKGLSYFHNKAVFGQTKQSLNLFLASIKIENIIV